MPRKQHKFNFIYKTTNLITGKFYIGRHSTSNLEDGYMGSGRILRRSIKKYGKENHKIEILEFLPSMEAVIIREMEVVNEELIKVKLCMNLIKGGEGFNGPHSEKSKKQISEFFKDKKYEDFHENPDLEKQKRAAGVKAHWAAMTVEEREKRSLALKQGRKGTKRQPFVTVLICPNCLKSGKGPAMKQWHFDNCKFKPALEQNEIKD